MYLHLGKDITVAKKDVLFILDMDNSTYSKRTQEFLKKAEREKRLLSVSLFDLPKSIVAVTEKGRTAVYISPISPQTLVKRATEYDFVT